MNTDFKYFKAPFEDVYRFSDQHPCVHCGEVAPATQVEMGEGDTPDKYCCLKCLSDGKSPERHETEFGYVEDGLICNFDIDLMESVPVDLPSGFHVENLDELSKTPQIESHQGQAFLVHCNDFMCFIGRWEPGDFENAGDGSARENYIQMADQDPQLWEATESEKAKYGEKWPAYINSKWAYGSWCYVFKCVHCGTLRCSWDCG